MPDFTRSVEGGKLYKQHIVQCRIQKIIGPLSAQMSVEYDPLLVLCTQNSLSAKLHQERGMQECISFGGEVATTVWSVRLIDQC